LQIFFVGATLAVARKQASILFLDFKFLICFIVRSVVLFIMNTTTVLPQTLSVSDARTNLYTIIKQVNDNLKRFFITHKGKPAAVVMSTEELESWEETLEILSDKKLYKEIQQAEKEIKQGKSIPLEKILKELNL